MRRSRGDLSRHRGLWVLVTVAALVIASSVVGVGPFGRWAAQATVPGRPGTPQPGTAVYFEDFNNTASSTTTPLGSYVGSSAALNSTYTGDPYWLNAAACNGFVLNALVTNNTSCNNATIYARLQSMAQALGQFNGFTTTAAKSQRALAELTNGATSGTVMLKSKTNNIPMTAGHFYNISAQFAAVEYSSPLGAGCDSIGRHPTDDPSLTFSLLDGPTKIPLATGLNPCTAPGATTVTTPGLGDFPDAVAALVTPALRWTGGATAGLELENLSTGFGNGNDAAFTNPTVTDVTPQLDKSFSPGTIAAGGVSTLTYTITNTLDLGGKSGWSFTDDLQSGVTATGVNSTTCTAGTVTAATGASAVSVAGNLNTGQSSCSVTVQVTASSPGTYVNGPANFPPGTAGLNGLNPPANTSLVVQPPASLVVTKQSSTTAITTVGQTVTYKFVVVNRGPSQLTGIQVHDTQSPPAAQGNLSVITCPVSTLAPNDSTTCAATYTVTQADLNHGSVADTATASGLDPSNATVTSPQSQLTIAGAQPAISVVKSTSTTLVSAVGQQVPYSFTVRNSGNVQLFDVAVTDTQTPPASQSGMSTVSCPQPSLAPGASEVCTGTYTATQADLVNGSVKDSAIATAANAAGTTVSSAPSTLSVPSSLPGALSIVKSSTAAALTAVGQVVPYSFQVTNNSALTISNVGVTDTQQPPASQANMGPITCTTTTLTAGASTTCTGSYTATRTDVTSGQLTDSAVAKGTDPANNPVTSSPSTVTLTVPITTLSVVKATSTSSAVAVGQQVPYTFNVTNTGNQPVTNVAVVDTPTPPSVPGNMSAVICPQPTLAVGASEVCSGSYTVSPADLANGSVNDSAVATGRDPSNNAVSSPQSSASVPVVTAALTLTKASSTDSFTQAGQLVQYGFTVANNSDVLYSNITVHDTQTPPALQQNLTAVACPQATLLPHTSETCTANYVVTQADIVHASVADTAFATGVDPGEVTFTTGTSSTVIPLNPQPAITVLKATTTSRIQTLGQQVAYTFMVTNSGNTALTGVAVTDTVLAPANPGNLTPVTCPTSSLTAGQATQCSATYTVTQTDLDKGFLADTATATGVAPTGASVTSRPSNVVITTVPALAVTKTSTTTTYDHAGQVIPFTYTVRNVSAGAVNNVSVTDTQQPPALQANLSAITCLATTLGAGASTTCTGNYTVTQPDVDNGAIIDTAVANAADPNGFQLPPSDPSTLTIPATSNPAITLTKSSSTSVITRAGQSIQYSYLVTNTGNRTLDNVDVTDTITPPGTQGNLSAVTCLQPSLVPGSFEVCTATYTTTQADVTNGSLTNRAVASGVDGNGDTATSAPSSSSIPAPTTAPPITLVKSSSSAIITALFQQITYGFLVTNTGTQAIANLTVSDTPVPPATQTNLSAVVCPATSLDPGASTTCTASYTVTQPDMDNGGVTDTATATASSPSGPVASAPSAVTVPVSPLTAGLSIVKSSSTPAITTVGQQVPYTFLVTNTGNQTVSGLRVNDTVTAPSAHSSLSPITCPVTTLAPAASTPCTATYTTTAADLNHGHVDDTAAAVATTSSGSTVSSNLSDLTVPVTQTPAITVVKSSTSAPTRAGDKITYSFVVMNTGNVSLNGVSVTDTQTVPAGALDAPGVGCPSTTLSPNASTPCTATYTVTQIDVDSGSVNDSATASGAPPIGPVVTSSVSSVSVPITAAPAITLVKSSTSAPAKAGDKISYSFLVTNTGNVTATGIHVTDTQMAPAGGLDAPGVTCPTTTLTPAASTTCTGVYTATQADVDNGGVNDTATATGTPPSGPAVTSKPSSVSVPIPPGPALTVAKSSSSTPTKAGDQIAYSFLVTNTGNVTVHNLIVTDTQTAPADALDAPGVTCPMTTLAPAGSTLCTAVYTTTQADADNGSVNDTATATGTPPSGPTVTSPASNFSVPVAANPELTVTKSSTSTPINAGDRITYSFFVTNTGTVTLHNVFVTDVEASPTSGALDAPGVTCPTTTLAPAESTTCTGAYTTTQADVDNGSVNDTATATGTDPTNADATSAPATLEVLIPAKPALTVAKSSTSAPVNAGDPISYSFLVTNTGNVTLAGIHVSDTQTAPAGALDPPGVTCPASTLAPAESTTCTGVYTTTQADIDNGSVNDTATATGIPPSGPAVSSAPSTLSVPIGAGPALTVAKSSTSAPVKAGDPITYSFLVANTGNVTLHDVNVTDMQIAPAGALDAPGVTCPTTTLAPAASTTCTGGYTTTQADVDNGAVDDTATAVGTDPTGTDAISTPSSISVPIPARPALTVVKSSSSTPAKAGDPITYSFLVTNNGNVTMAALQVTDLQLAGAGVLDAPGVTCPVTTLAPGGSTLCTGTYTTTQVDVDNGSVNDTATVTGTPPSGPPVTSPPSAVSVPIPASPGLTVVKSSSSTPTKAGDQIAYSFLVTNTGALTLHNVNVTDIQASPAGALDAPGVTCPTTTLAPAGSTLCTGAYTTTQGDVDNGSVNDTATASGTDPTNTVTTSSPATLAVPVPANPALTVVKSSSSTPTKAGDRITYSFLVTNTGALTLHNVSVTDIQASPAGALDAPGVTCPTTTLAPAGSTTCTGIYTTTQTDIDNGSVNDTAAATGSDPTNIDSTSPPATLAVPILPNPALTVLKSATATPVNAGDQIVYSFVVTNGGNVTLHDALVTDTQTAPAGDLDAPGVICPTTTLVPAGSTTCTGVYTTTQADIDNGSVNDSATATATPPSGPSVTSTPSSVAVPIPASPAITLVKTSTSTPAKAGDQIDYDFLVTNTGDVTLHDVRVDDTQTAPAGALNAPGVSCPATTLAPSGSTTCTGVYTTTQADVDDGSVHDTATATGTYAVNATAINAAATTNVVASFPSALTVPIPPKPALTLLKTASPTVVRAVGDQITYSFLVTNTGNVTETGATVTDPKLARAGIAVSCPTAVLAPGVSEMCHSVRGYVVSQADVTAGFVDNTATASAMPPTHPGGPAPPSVSSSSSTAHVTVAPIPPTSELSTPGEPTNALSVVPGSSGGTQINTGQGANADPRGMSRPGLATGVGMLAVALGGLAQLVGNRRRTLRDHGR